MTWDEVRAQYPHRWLLVEAVIARTVGEDRVIDKLIVLGEHADSLGAWEQYRIVHSSSPFRELYVLHSDRPALDVRVRYEPLARGVRVRQ
jgi:hypothetical protein